MSGEVRGFLAASLISLVAAATLHVPAMAGGGTSWVAFLHATLFGWACGIIVAVRYHTLPSITGRQFPGRWLVRAHLLVFVIGGVLAVGGYVMGWPGATAWGLALQLAGALVFLLNTSLILRPKPMELQATPPPIRDQGALDRLNGVATFVATCCLSLSLALLLAVRMRWLPGSWYLAGIHTATLGFVVLMIIGVAYRTLPRWNMCPTCGARYARVQLGLFFVALVTMVGALGTARSPLFVVGAMGMAASLALFAWTISPPIRGAAAGGTTPTPPPGTTPTPPGTTPES